MNIIENVVSDNKLCKLIQEQNFVGWIYSINYEKALLMTNDAWKEKVRGIPHNSFLIATNLNVKEYASSNEIDREVILLRVVNSCKLPQDDDIIKAKIDNYQNQVEIDGADKNYDILTRNKMQFGGLECRVLGTFYLKNGELNLGSDIENFSTSLKMKAYMPRGEALEEIVNYVDPIRKSKFKEDFKELGITKEVEPFKIGTVRYTSTDRLHRSNMSDLVPFSIQPSDFLARRTAVLGMTRTGKSNMIKQTVSVVKKVAEDCSLSIGQLIYDINGEYANANEQDKGSISSIFNSDCVKYRMIETPGFYTILNNFYEQLQEGHSIICECIKEKSSGLAQDISQFMGLSFDIPEDRDGKYRYYRKVALYKTLLFAAGFEASSNYKVKFVTNSKICQLMGITKNTFEEGLTLAEAKLFFIKLRENREKEDVADWITEEMKPMLNLLCQKNEKDSFINGYRQLIDAKKYHCCRRQDEVSKEIYNHLSNGKIVIIDLSVGNAVLRDKISKKIAEYVFNTSMSIFTNGNKPNNIVVYIEEAHNLIGKGMELTDTWPRLAKEGAKYKIGLVYATQEVSSIHPNILSNTENWFVSHLNSDREIKELSRFYDFEDFSQSLLKSQDVGFSRVKTLSSPFVVPIQIDKFEPSIFVRKNHE